MYCVLKLDFCQKQVSFKQKGNEKMGLGFEPCYFSKDMLFTDDSFFVRMIF